MDSYTFYRFKDGTNVKLLHCSNNKWAAEQAMLRTFGKSSSDISHTGMNELNYRPYSTFDGRDFH